MINPYLDGDFAPLHEEFTLTDLDVTGTVPDYLDGRYLRNGPNPIGEIDPELYHWFLGDGMLHGISIRDGRPQWYRNRWIRGPVVARAQGGTPRGRHLGPSGIGANTNVIGHNGRTLALIEAGYPVYELSEELDTIGPYDFDGTLSGGYTAHPKRDPLTGELHAVSYRFGRGNTVQYSVLGADGRLRRTVDVEMTGAPMMHDFSLTDRHVVFYDLPVTFDTRQSAEMTVPQPLRLSAQLLLSALIGRVRIPDPIVARLPQPKDSDRRFPYRWNPTYPARIGVMSRDGSSSDVRWFDIDRCYVFHTLNAYDNGDTVVLDVIRHRTIFDRDMRGPAEDPPTLDRWTVDLAAGTVRASRIDERAQEFPRVDERRLGKQHRYGYAPGLGDATLYKHDFVSGSTATKWFGPGKAPGEFVFEPSSADAAEDQGVLMGFVYDRATDRSDLAILDAQTLENIANIHLPHRVPAGFHGNWLPAAR